MRSLARWCFRRKYVVLAVWIVALLVLGGLSASAGSGYTDSFSLPGTESTTALDLLTDNFDTESTDTNQVVFAADDVNDPAIKARIEKTLDAIAKGPHVERVDSPFAQGAAARQIAKDGKVAFANVHMDGEQPIADVPKSAYDKLIDTAEAARGDGLQVELGGSGIQQAGQSRAAARASSSASSRRRWCSHRVRLAVGDAAAADHRGARARVRPEPIGLIAHAIAIATFAPTLATLIGLGVGIDYALFVVTRHRNAITAGREPEAAASGAEHVRASRPVRGRDRHRRAARPVRARHQLPQRRRGRRGDRRAHHDDGRGHADPRDARHHRHAGAVKEGTPAARRRGTARPNSTASGPAGRDRAGAPRPLAIAALVIMLALAVPALSLRLGSSDQGHDPTSTTTRKAYDLLAEGFGAGFNGPSRSSPGTPEARRTPEGPAAGRHAERDRRPCLGQPARPSPTARSR